MKLDLRSLALFRITIGLCVLCDLINRSQYLAYHYTDHGVLPRESLIRTFGDGWRLSLHNWNGSVSAAWMMFIASGFAALMMTVGWRTRLFTFITYVLNLSLQNRNPLVIQGGDVFLRIVLLLSVFLPLGARYSFDRLFRFPETSIEPEPTSSAYRSPATYALGLQVMCLYFFTGLMKWLDPSWHSGSGAYFSFNTYQFETRLGVFLGSVPLFTHVMNWVIPFSEMIFVSNNFHLELKVLDHVYIFLE